MSRQRIQTCIVSHSGTVYFHYNMYIRERWWVQSSAGITPQYLDVRNETSTFYSELNVYSVCDIGFMSGLFRAIHQRCAYIRVLEINRIIRLGQEHYH